MSKFGYFFYRKISSSKMTKDDSQVLAREYSFDIYLTANLTTARCTHTYAFHFAKSCICRALKLSAVISKKTMDHCVCFGRCSNWLPYGAGIFDCLILSHCFFFCFCFCICLDDTFKNGYSDNLCNLFRRLSTGRQNETQIIIFFNK